MIRFEIEGKVLALYPNTKYRFDINSSLFDNEAIQGSYVCPFDVPTGENREIFKNAEFIEVNRNYKIYKCKIFLEDKPLYDADFILNTTMRNKYRCSAIINGISPEFVAKKLRELDYGDEINIGGNPHDAANVVQFASMYNSTNLLDLVFPMMYAPNFYGSSSDEEKSPTNSDYGGKLADGADYTGKIINNWDKINQEFRVNSIKQDTQNTDLADNAFVMVPMFKLIFILNKIFENTGYDLKGDFVSDEFIKKLILINNYAIDQKYKKYFVAAGSTSEQEFDSYARLALQDDISIGYEDNGNCFDTALYEYTIKEIGEIDVKIRFKAKSLSNYIMNQLRVGVSIVNGSLSNIAIDDIRINTTYQEFSVETSFFALASDLNKKIIITMYMPNQNPFTFYVKEAKVNFIHTSYQNLNQFQNKIKIKNHVGYSSVGEFCNALRKNFGLAWWFSAEEMRTEINFAKDILQSYKAFDVTEYVVKDSCEISNEEQNGYIISQKSDTESKDISLYELIGVFEKKSMLTIPDKLNVVAEVLQEGMNYIFKKNEESLLVEWQEFGSSVKNAESGNKKQEVSMDIEFLPNSIKYGSLMPVYLQEGVSEAFETGVNECEIALAIWHGMNADSNGMEYPYASCLRLNQTGNANTDNELRLDGNYGLWEKYMKPWYEFLQNAEPVKLQIKAGSKEIFEILNLFKPQENSGSQQKRKIRYKNILMLPKSFSFIVSEKGKNIEAEINCYKDGGVEL